MRRSPRFTAFATQKNANQILGRLVVSRIPDINPRPGQPDLFDTRRFHAFFTTSTLDTITADKTHRGHAIIEQVHADLKNSALAHLPQTTSPPTPPQTRSRPKPGCVLSPAPDSPPAHKVALGERLDHTTGILAVLAVVVLSSLVGPVLAYRRGWHLPVVLGELLIGILLGATGVRFLDASEPTFTFLAEFSFGLMMVVAGTHVPVLDVNLQRALAAIARAVLVSAGAAVLGVVLAAVFGATGVPQALRAQHVRERRR